MGENANGCECNLEKREVLSEPEIKVEVGRGETRVRVVLAAAEPQSKASRPVY